ncbi:MAG: Nif3-like dinuclear metal center hexameric protein, partial [Bacteroidota bacterium]
IAKQLRLKNTRILAPKTHLKKLTALVPPAYSDVFRQSLLAIETPNQEQPLISNFSGVGMKLEQQTGKAVIRIEVLFTPDKMANLQQILQRLGQKEEISYHISDIAQANKTVGSGMIGQVQNPMPPADFMIWLKARMNLKSIRHTALLDKPIQTVAVCGGAGSFLLKHAIRQKADVFITADYKYHDFFDADGRIIIADIGHYESEQFTIALLHELISEKFSNFASYQTTVCTNPVYYS